MEILFVLLILWGLAWGAYKLFLLLFRPDIFLEEKRQRHELEMARRARNRQALGAFGYVVGLLFRK